MTGQEEGLKRFNYLTSEIDGLYHNIAMKLEMSDSVMNVLYTIYQQGEGCNQSTIYKLVCVSRQTVNTAIHKLVKEDILYLEDGEGKNKKVFLTDKGKTIVDQKIRPLLDAENAVFSSWSIQDQRELIRLTEKYLVDMGDKVSTFIEG